MPRTIETTVYTINELPDAAKAQAREWYIENVLNNDGLWHEPVYSDFENICGILGITLRRWPTAREGQQKAAARRPCIWFTGFCHQGDGACFEGTWEYAAGSCRGIREHAPLDERLHAIADGLAAAQKPNFYDLCATITQRGHYFHEHAMEMDVGRNSDSAREPTEGSSEAVIKAMHDLARWLYRTLEQEYQYETSDEGVDEVLQANEWEFTAEGRFFRC